MSNERELDLIISNQKIQHELQQKTFDQVANLTSLFLAQKGMCNERFVVIETTKKIDSKWKTGIRNTIYVFAGGSMAWLTKPIFEWLKTKLGI